MMEDKIKATDWEATNEAIEEQVRKKKVFFGLFFSEVLL